MTPPENVELHNHEQSVWWIEEDGLICSVSKKADRSTSHDDSAAQLAELKRITGGKKLCMLLDITNARPTRREDREFAAEEIAKIVKAMAIVSKSALGKMVANLFFNLKPPPYPAKMFNSEKEARDWIKQYY